MGRFEQKRRGVSAKALVLLLAAVLLLGGAIGGTLAWLTAKTEAVVNTFTVGDINIDLTETTSDYKLVPGSTIAKDPTVTVKAGSEACWLFVKVEQSENLSSFIDYVMADGWTELESGVYYREVPAAEADVSFPVIAVRNADGTLANNQVKVRDSVTKEMLTAADFTNPTLSFTTYAVQKDNVATAADAWDKAPKD